MSPSLSWLRDTSARDVPAATGRAGSTSELVAQRERLTERFALMQSELGGLFYEMAIRDHVQMDVLVAKAAELQLLDVELGQIEHLLATDGGQLSGHCQRCSAPHGRGAAFCSQCGAALQAS